jgi:transcriptional regulator with PAS, ATPase and Fis domain
VSDDAPHLVGVSSAIRAVDAEVACAARSDAKVLITGESGVGKEVVARLLHQRSHRAHRPMIAINCAGVPDALLESELFGHMRGSFTDAYRDRLGLLEMADGGTIFLDEVAEMSPRMQALLLRFLESGEIQRVGADRIQARADVRVIAATNRNIHERIASKDFRDDLYYRLNVIHITIPPLRARPEDIPLFLEYFLRTYAAQRGIPPPALEPDTLDHLVAYHWPGNVRELKNAVERLVVRARTGVISLADLPAAIQVRRRDEASPSSLADALFERMVAGGEPFWSVVHPLFMARDLTHLGTEK